MTKDPGQICANVQTYILAILNLAQIYISLYLCKYVIKDQGSTDLISSLNLNTYDFRSAQDLHECVNVPKELARFEPDPNKSNTMNLDDKRSGPNLRKCTSMHTSNIRSGPDIH